MGSLEENGNGILSSLSHPMEVDYCTNLDQAIAEAYERQLIPLKEDVCLWLNELLGVTVHTEQFMAELSNGLVLCKLAEFISETAYEHIAQRKSDQAVPRLTHEVWKQAKKGTFFARENVANFIEFCRRVGVHDVLCFETEDLVQEIKDRPIVICLLELARMAHRNWKVEPPSLVKLEFELDNESTNAEDSGLGEGSSNSSVLGNSSKCSNSQRKEQSTPSRLIGVQRRAPVSTPRKSSKSAIHTTPLREVNKGSSSTPRLPVNQNKKPKSRRESLASKASTPNPSNILTHKATEIAIQSGRVCACSSSQCSRNHLKKVSEGKYEIYGKVFNIRLLNNNHVMVRVGGGWDTLEHYLLTHEPVEVTSTNGNTPKSDHTVRGRYVSPQAPRIIPRSRENI